MGFRLTPRSMTLDDLELYKLEFSVNFAGSRNLGHAHFQGKLLVRTLGISHTKLQRVLSTVG